MPSNFTAEQQKALIAKLRTLTLNTELSGSSALVNTFTLSTGKSSYAFGINQNDVLANRNTAPFLKSIGFTDAEVTSLQTSTAMSASQLAPLNAKLAAHIADIDTFTDKQMAIQVAKLSNIINYVSSKDPSVANALRTDTTLQMAVMDYDNQFNIQGIGNATPDANTLLAYLSGNSVQMQGGTLTIPGTPTSADIQSFINVTKQGMQDPRGTAGRASRFATGMGQVNSGQVLTTDTANQTGVMTFSSGLSQPLGDLQLYTTDLGEYHVIGQLGTMTATQIYSTTSQDCSITQSYNLTDGTLQYTVAGSLPANGPATLNISGFNVPAYSTGATIQLDPGTRAIIEGKGNAVQYSPNCTVIVGGNGQLSSDTDLDTVTVRAPYVTSIGANVQLLNDTRANVYINNGQVTSNPHVTAGVLGAGNSIFPQPTDGFYVGGNGMYNSTPNKITLQGVVTAMSNSSLQILSGSGDGVYTQDNTSVALVNTSNLQVHVNGNNSTVGSQGNGDVIYNTGYYNTINALGNNITSYNYNANAHGNNMGFYDHIFNYATQQYGYNANSTDSITGGSVSGVVLGSYFGFAGSRTNVLSTINTPIKTGAASFAALGGAEYASAAEAARTQVQWAINHDVPSTVTGKKWDHTVITWSVGSVNDGYTSKFGKTEELAARSAFATWAAASGLTFQEVSDSKKADITLGWADLDTANSGVIGYTTSSDKAGYLQSGVKIQLEDKSVKSLAGGAIDTGTYAGTDATLSQVLLHEIGHAIGLSTNSDPTSIESYYLGSANQALNSNDILTIQELYGTATNGPASLRSPGLDQMIQSMATFATTQLGAIVTTQLASNDPNNHIPLLATSH